MRTGTGSCASNRLHSGVSRRRSSAYLVFLRCCSSSQSDLGFDARGRAAPLPVQLPSTTQCAFDSVAPGLDGFFDRIGELHGDVSSVQLLFEQVACRLPFLVVANA